MVDWGTGHYEEVARQLEPVAERVVETTAVEDGERVLDLGCGSGNAALAAARRGAIATGVDPAERLLEVARERARAESLEVTWVRAAAEELPFADDSFDRVVSVFGVVFAGDPERAVAETVRVLRPDVEAVLTAWIPAGPIDAMVGAIRGAMEAVTGQTTSGFPWSDKDAVAALAERHGAAAAFEDAEAEFAGESPEAYFANEEANHPMSIAMRPVLADAGVYDRVREEAIAELRKGNEDPDAFCVHSPYRIIRLRP